MSHLFSKYKNFYFVFIFLISALFLRHIVFAQDGSGFDTQNSSALSGGEDDGVNLYLQKAIRQDNGLKTKAEQFNGKRSGVYEGSALACPYAFERDLIIGTKGEDVRLLQVILNSDKRTIIAVDGPGSPGQETTIFGEATRRALKKLQALFYDEYVQVVDGKFNQRTRTVVNAICNGESRPRAEGNIEVRQDRNIYENIFSVQRAAVPGGIVTTNTSGADLTAPRVSLSANTSTVKMGETFKVILNASEIIVPITPDSFIVDGGTVKEIRKLSKTSYTATINVNDDAKKILIQIEADKVEDLAGNKNESASNEISIKVLAAAKTATDESVGGEASVNSLLDKIISAAPTCTYSATGILIKTDAGGKTLNTTGCAEQQTQNLAGSGQTYDCNGSKIPVTQPCQQQSQTVCTTTTNPVTGFPMQQCQQVTPQQAQANQAAQQQRQQDQQNQELGKLLGQALGKNGFGQDGNRNGQGSGASNGGGGGGGGSPFAGLPSVVPSGATQTPPLKEQAKIGQEILDFCKKPENKSDERCSAESIAAAKAVIKRAVTEPDIPGQTITKDDIDNAEKVKDKECASGRGPDCFRDELKLEDLKRQQQLQELSATKDPTLAVQKDINNKERQIQILNQQKELCEKKSGEEKTKCLERADLAIVTATEQKEELENKKSEIKDEHISGGEIQEVASCTTYALGSRTNISNSGNDTLILIGDKAIITNASFITTEDKKEIRKTSKDLATLKNKCFVSYFAKSTREVTCSGGGKHIIYNPVASPVGYIPKPVGGTCATGEAATNIMKGDAKEKAAKDAKKAKGDRAIADMLRGAGK